MSCNPQSRGCLNHLNVDAVRSCARGFVLWSVLSIWFDAEGGVTSVCVPRGVPSVSCHVCLTARGAEDTYHTHSIMDHCTLLKVFVLQNCLTRPVDGS